MIPNACTQALGSLEAYPRDTANFMGLDGEALSALNPLPLHPTSLTRVRTTVIKYKIIKLLWDWYLVYLALAMCKILKMIDFCQIYQ
jgi:hypothetical protein